jgi:dienelactone hydrolase
MRTMKMIDSSRLNPTAQQRAIMISLFYPVPRGRCRETCLVEYMPLATARYENDILSQTAGVPSRMFEQLRLQICCEHSRIRQADLVHPVVLFSPGAGSPRLYYSAMAQTLASAGYFVVTMDHPYDASVVEFPGGSLVFGQDLTTLTPEQLTLEVLPLWVRTRARDAAFVLDQLATPSVMQQLIPGAEKGLDTSCVGMYGHSLGGAAAIASMANDGRIVGAANMDGGLFLVEGVVDSGAVLLFGTSEHNRMTDETWATAYPKFRQWKLEVDLQGAAHGIFADFGLLLNVTGLEDMLPPEVQAQFGSLPGVRAFEVITTYIEAFFDLVLRQKRSPLLKKPDPRYPEVILRP